MLLFAALLAPAVRALPAWTAGTAGKGAWLTGIMAFPVLLLMGWALFALCGTMPKGSGLADVSQAVLGPVLGKGLTIIYMVWALFLLCLETRLYGERMLAAHYKNASLAAFLLILLLLVLWMGRKKLAAFARATEIFYLILALTLGLVLFFSIADLTPENVLPVWTGDLPATAAATMIPLGVMGVGIFSAFLGGSVASGEKDRRRGLRWLAAICVVFTVLPFGVLAQLGPVLSARMDEPFFEVARGVGISGAFQRVESVVAAIWVLSNLSLLGLLVFSCRAMVKSVFSEKWDRWTAPVAVVAAFLGALLLFPDGFTAKMVASTVALYGNLLLGFAVPLLVLLIRQVQTARR